MVYYTEFSLTYKGVDYHTCDRDGFEKYVQSNIRKLLVSYDLYGQYITNMLKFLNINRSDDESEWPEWSISSYYCGDNLWFIDLENMSATNSRKTESMGVIMGTDARKDPEFIRFLNNRFMLDRIWKKYNVPRDLSNWIQENYF